VVYIHNGKLFSHKDENIIIWGNMNVTGGHYAK
jgi:hypothetical protein